MKVVTTELSDIDRRAQEVGCKLEVKLRSRDYYIRLQKGDREVASGSLIDIENALRIVEKMS